MANIKFGTDGWRAVIAEDFTFANVARVTQAAADHWRANPVAGTRPLVVVGFDRRFLSGEFARSIAEILAGNELRVLLTRNPTPTPAVSFAVKQHRAVGGVMITASHNPPRFNGYKLKAHFGGSADADESHAVEARLDRSPIRILSFEQAVREQRIVISDLRPAHFRAIKRLVDIRLVAGSNLRVAHDALFGVGAGCFETLLAKTTCRVTTLNGANDPLFGGINPEPLPKNYALGSAQLRRNPHDICLVTDGDSDRIGAMDGRGNPLTNQQVIALLLHHLVRNRGRQGRIIKTVNTTSMVAKMCAAWNLPLTEVGIGFRFIAPELMKPDALFGAEESGSVGFANHIPERDGLAAGLFLLEMLAMECITVNRVLARLAREFGPHRYGRHDAQFPLERRDDLMERLKTNPPRRLLRSPLISINTLDGVKFTASDGSWLMLRGSGTEPVLRIYAEASSDDKVKRLLQFGVSLTRRS